MGWTYLWTMSSSEWILALLVQVRFSAQYARASGVRASRLPGIGVAVYSHNLPKPIVIQNWPSSDNIVYKVPTAIAYRAGNFRPQSWGLACPPPGKIGPGICVKRLFKLFLDEEFLQKTFERNPDDAPGDIDDVRA